VIDVLDKVVRAEATALVLDHILAPTRQCS